MSADRPKGPESPKQKIILGLVIVVSLFVVWQIYGLFAGEGGGEAPAEITPAQPQPMTAAAPGMPAAPGPAAAGTSGLNAPTVVAPAATPVLRQEVVQQNSEILKLARQNEPKYIAALSELEMLKLEREIAETNQAITLAKLGTVTTEQNIAELLTKATLQTGSPPPESAPVPEGPTGSASLGPASQELLPSGPTPEEPQQQPQPQGPPGMQGPQSHQPKIEPYKLVSISYQNNKWRGVISYQGKLIPIVVGDILPADDSVVVGITKDTIVLKKDETKRTLQIVKAL